MRKGGNFSWTMTSKDDKMGFDFGGIYDEIIQHKLISCSLDEWRNVEIKFTKKDDETLVEHIFELERTNLEQLQEGGWQTILNNIKGYVEK